MKSNDTDHQSEEQLWVGKQTKYEDLRHDLVVSRDAEMFKSKLRELIEKDEDFLPRGFVQRYGPDPLFEFACAGESQRKAMVRAVQCLLGEDVPSHEVQSKWVMMQLSSIAKKVRVEYPIPYSNKPRAKKHGVPMGTSTTSPSPACDEH